MIQKTLFNAIQCFRKRGLVNVSKESHISSGLKCYNKANLIMEGQCSLGPHAEIMNTRAKFIMKKWSGSAVGLFAVTGNHLSVVGMNLKQVTDEVKDKLDTAHEMDKDILVEEDVWIGANVTLLAGVVLGRGCVVGAGCVVRSGKVPPYAILTGNPAKVIAFRFTPEEIIEHERALYPKEERLSKDVLDKNYEKYFLHRIKDIKSFTKL